MQLAIFDHRPLGLKDHGDVAAEPIAGGPLVLGNFFGESFNRFFEPENLAFDRLEGNAPARNRQVERVDHEGRPHHEPGKDRNSSEDFHALLVHGGCKARWRASRPHLFDVGQTSLFPLEESRLPRLTPSQTIAIGLGRRRLAGRIVKPVFHKFGQLPNRFERIATARLQLQFSSHFGRQGQEL